MISSAFGKQDTVIEDSDGVCCKRIRIAAALHHVARAVCLALALSTLSYLGSRQRWAMKYTVAVCRVRRYDPPKQGNPFSDPEAEGEGAYLQPTNTAAYPAYGQYAQQRASPNGWGRHAAHRRPYGHTVRDRMHARPATLNTNWQCPWIGAPAENKRIDYGQCYFGKNSMLCDSMMSTAGASIALLLVFWLRECYMAIQTARWKRKLPMYSQPPFVICGFLALEMLAMLILLCVWSVSSHVAAQNVDRCEDIARQSRYTDCQRAHIYPYRQEQECIPEKYVDGFVWRLWNDRYRQNVPAKRVIKLATSTASALALVIAASFFRILMHYQRSGSHYGGGGSPPVQYSQLSQIDDSL
ncbi:uncharacterized protein LOC135805931 [Sycon ciliatum]|uniref:uncharacterized protein LOC135805931 n=1 Tax=Sycon ciliatum TaxID=27933 RepID=UPI0031F6C885